MSLRFWFHRRIIAARAGYGDAAQRRLVRNCYFWHQLRNSTTRATCSSAQLACRDRIRAHASVICAALVSPRLRAISTPRKKNKADGNPKARRSDASRWRAHAATSSRRTRTASNSCRQILSIAKSAAWPGLRVEIVTVHEQLPFDYGFKSHQHLLIAAEHADRNDGETLVEGLPKSTLQSFSGRLTFVPADHEFYGWQDPRVLTRVNYFYIDPLGLPLDDGDCGFPKSTSAPACSFPTASCGGWPKSLKSEVTNNGGRLRHYGAGAQRAARARIDSPERGRGTSGRPSPKVD